MEESVYFNIELRIILGSAWEVSQMHAGVPSEHFSFGNNRPCSS